MLLTLVLIFQITVTFANPYSNYPFVRLLNVGNEELDKTNTEQIRVSLPGRSAALRYPAFGFGDKIINVKVTAIDFVKNVKAKIVDGGPGFNYVVLAFLGNSVMPYDVLVTLQTKSNTKKVFDSVQSTQNDVFNKRVDNSDPYGVEYDRNDSSEDAEEESPNFEKRKTSINFKNMQPSPNVQIYDVNSEAYSGKEKYRVDSDNEQDYAEDEENIEDSENEIDEQNNDFENEVNKNAMNDSSESDEADDDIAYAEDIHKPTPEEFNKSTVTTETSSSTQSYSNNIDIVPVEEKYNENNYDDDSEVKVDSNLFRMYEALRPHLNYNNVVEQKEKNDNDENENFDYKDTPAEIDQMFNDEEVHNYNKYSNNNDDNNFDTDDTYAVEY